MTLTARTFRRARALAHALGATTIPCPTCRGVVKVHGECEACGSARELVVLEGRTYTVADFLEAFSGREERS